MFIFNYKNNIKSIITILVIYYKKYYINYKYKT